MPQSLLSKFQSRGRVKTIGIAQRGARHLSSIQPRNIERASTWSSWRPAGNASSSALKSSSQGAFEGRRSCLASILADWALMRVTLSLSGPDADCMQQAAAA